MNLIGVTVHSFSVENGSYQTLFQIKCHKSSKTCPVMDILQQHQIQML